MHTEDYVYLHELEERFWWFVGMRAITSALLDPFCLPASDRMILDVGCGTGGNLIWLARYAGTGRVLGIDREETPLHLCRSNDIQLLAQASATALPYAEESFDLVTSFDVLCQIPGAGEDDRAIDEMYRVLATGVGNPPTRFDPQVRDTWEIPKSRIKIDEPRWGKTLGPLLEHMRRDLGFRKLSHTHFDLLLLFA